MTTPTTLPGHVLAELLALHWSSWGNGATIPELVGALKIRGVDVEPHQVADVLADDLGTVVVKTERARAFGRLGIDWTVYEPVG